MTVIYKDASRPVEERVADLLSRMTLEEKFAQMHGYWLVLDENGEHRERSDMSDEFAGVSEQTSLAQRLKLGVGQITRPLGTHIVAADSGVRAANRLQKMLMEETRLGIPALFHEECLVGLLCKEATLFPSSLNYGSTWDPELWRGRRGKSAPKRVRPAASRGLPRCWTSLATCAGGVRKRPSARTRGWSASWPAPTLTGCRAKSATCWQR